MVTYYEPSQQDYDQAWQDFRGLLRRYRGRAFKIGRCAVADANRLSTRSEYQDASAIHGVWAGSKGKCATMEDELILWAMQKLADLCLNEQVGGGPQSTEEEHVVYVVFW